MLGGALLLGQNRGGSSQGSRARKRGKAPQPSATGTAELSCSLAQGMYLPRVEARQLAVLEREPVVQPHQLHEHVGDQDAQVFDVACLVQDGHRLGIRIERLRWRGGFIVLRLLLLLLGR